MISSLVPAILRHLQGYVDVAGADARDAGALIARRVAALLLAAVAAEVALLMFCVFLLALAWDGPWRAWTAAALFVLFAAACAALALPVLRPGSRPKNVLFPRVRHELDRDRDLIERALNGGSEAQGS
jgi:uncharacterized membrane protein YqjE